MDILNDFVNVAVRIRPSSIDNPSSEGNLKIIHNNPSILCVLDRQQTFSFDYIFDSDADQASVFSSVIKPMIDKMLLGYNCTVFAYGQTGTGKTYTMGDPQNLDSENMGMISRTCKEIFKNLSEDIEIDVEVSVYEIYNEKVYDLLGDIKVALPVKGFKVYGLKREPISDLEAVQDFLLMAGKNRRTGGTRQNTNSSRSHAIYTIYCSVGTSNALKTGKFNFVDLAGSESVRKTGNEGHQFFEGININKGLLCVGQVINALSLNKPYIPYRQSILTTMLQDSLNKTNNVTLIACISANPSDATETLQTLEFAQRAKRLVSKPEISSIANQTMTKSPLLTVKRPVIASRFFTPMKKSFPLHTSTSIKRLRPLHSPLAFDISGESSLHGPPLNYSPIVRKCVEVLECTLLKKIDMLIKENTMVALRKSARISSTRLCNGYNVMSKVERKKNSKVSGTRAFRKKSENNHSNANQFTLSPMEEQRASSENSSEGLAETACDEENAIASRSSSSPEFKIPCVTLRRLNSTQIVEKCEGKQVNDVVDETRTLAEISDDVRMENTFKIPQRRRSSRINIVPVRRSVRLSMKLSAHTSSLIANESIRELTVRPKVKRKPDIHENTEIPKKRIKEDTLRYKHTDEVLKILNCGTTKKLQSLYTIGQKTADQILLYRELRGKFKNIMELKNVLNRGKAYERFLSGNFLED